MAPYCRCWLHLTPFASCPGGIQPLCASNIQHGRPAMGDRSLAATQSLTGAVTMRCLWHLTRIYHCNKSRQWTSCTTQLAMKVEKRRRCWAFASWCLALGGSWDRCQCKLIQASTKVRQTWAETHTCLKHIQTALLRLTSKPSTICFGNATGLENSVATCGIWRFQFPSLSKCTDMGWSSCARF